MSVDSIGDYLRKIGAIKLLSPEEEVRLGTLLQKWMEVVKIKEKYLKDNPEVSDISDLEWSRLVDLSPAELNALINQGKFAQKRMIECNLRLVVSIAKKYQNRGIDFLDLIQEGSEGLATAANRFDPAKGCRFSTVAYWWIRQAITRVISQHSRPVRLPSHLYEKLNKIKAARRKFRALYNREPKAEELAGILEITVDQLFELKQYGQSTLSLNIKLQGADEQLELIDHLLLPSDDDEEDIVLHELLHTVLDQDLNVRERYIIMRRFGFEPQNSKSKESLAEIAREINISRERARQIEAQALRKLKRNPRLQSISYTAYDSRDKFS